MPIRRLPIPATRLPFVNAEIAEVALRGSPHLVSSIWGGSLGGRLYFWNPETGHHLMRELPHGIPGAYMLRTGDDGALYLGCGDGSLLRYDGASDQFSVLSRGELDQISWGGAVLGRKVFWNASHKGQPGAVACYDLDAARTVKVFGRVDPGSPQALYGHCAQATPDGRVLWGLNVPQARLAIFDPATLTHEVLTPTWLQGSSWVWAYFVGPDRLLVHAAEGYYPGQLRLLAWPSLEPVREFPPHPQPKHTHSRPVVIGHTLYQVDMETGTLWGLDSQLGQWQCHEENFTEPGTCTLGVWRGQSLAVVSVSGYATWRRAPGDLHQLDLEATGVLPAHALCAVPEHDLLVGAPFINQRFWTMRLSTGEGQDRGRAAPGGGQINQILWEPKSQRALLSSYTSASITAYAPAQPALNWPANPRLLATAKPQGQMRPLAMVHDGQAVWMACSPQYGTLGGALCRLGPVSGDWRVWRHLVPELRPTHLVADPARDRLFIGFDIYADCGSAPPTQKTGLLGVFDTRTCRLTATRVIHAEAPAACPHALLPDGRVLVCQGPRFYAWEPVGDKLADLGELPAGLARIFNGPGQTLLAATRDSLGILHEAGGVMHYTPKLKLSGTAFHHWVGETLYCAAGTEILLIPLAELLG